MCYKDLNYIHFMNFWRSWDSWNLVIWKLRYSTFLWCRIWSVKYCACTMSYGGGGGYRYSPLSKYASSHGLSGSSHGLSGNNSLYGSYSGLQSNPYVSPYSSPLSPGLGSGYSSRSGSTSSLSSIGSLGSTGSYPGSTSSIPYRVGISSLFRAGSF